MEIQTGILVFFLFLKLNAGLCLQTNGAVTSFVKIISSEELSKVISETQSKDGVESLLSEESRNVANDNGYGNPGDLIYRYRESNDVLQIREVIVLPEISSDVQEVQWYASTPARRITTVRVLNFGRERAYTLRIDVAGNEVQTILRIPQNADPRIMIEVYGL